MPATPAWPPSNSPRLYVAQRIEDGAELALSGPPAHYLLSVMRLKVGDAVRIFDNLTGEWLSVVASASKRDLVLRVDAKLSDREEVPDLWLLTAPIRKGRIDWIYEKACELGVARIIPVITRRTIVDKVNRDRLHAHLVEAAEQCGRTAIPEMGDVAKLDKLLAEWPGDRPLLFADETGGVPLMSAVRRGPAAILIGPEGGFAPEEAALIRALPSAIGVSLGPRILRADTAAIAAVATWMSVAGDWR